MAGPHSQQTDVEGLHFPKGWSIATSDYDTLILRKRDGTIEYINKSTLGATGPQGEAGNTFATVNVLSIFDPSVELNALHPTNKDAVFAVQNIDALINESSLYMYDVNSASPEDIPFVVTHDDGGQWRMVTSTNPELSLAKPLEVFGQTTNEPTGFPERETTSTYTFDNATRLFTISPVATSYVFYEKAKKYISTGDSVIIDDEEGLHHVYYELGVLKSSHVLTHKELIIDKVVVATVYWDFTNKKQIGIGDQRHEFMAGVTHFYLDTEIGTVYHSGGALGDLLVDQSGDLDTHAQLSVASTKLIDLDIFFEHLGLAAPASWTKYYKDGANGYYREITADAFPMTTAGTGRAAFNEESGGVWQLTEITSNDYFHVHIIATDDLLRPYVSIIGQASYNLEAEAQDAAETAISELNLANFPFESYIFLGTIIAQTSDGMTNAVKSAFTSTGDGADYVDFRQKTLGSAGGSESHSGLSGLIAPSDDHTQYMHLPGRLNGQVLNGGVNSGGNLDFESTAHATKGAVRVLDGNNLLVGTGYVGIGTATPLTNLHVEGTNPKIIVSDSDSTSDLTAAGRVEFWDRNVSRVGFFGFTQSSEDFLIINDTTNGVLDFRTNNTTRITVLSNGLTGIGTTTPLARLHINDGDPKIIMSDSNSTSELTYSGRFEMWDRDVNRVGMFGFTSGTNENFEFINDTATGSLIFRTATTERMRIKADGKIGVGTTTPSVDFHFLSDAPAFRLSDGNAATDAACTGLFQFYRGAATSELGYFGYPSGSNTHMEFVNKAVDGDVVFRTATTARMRITYEGDISLGNNSSPSRFLHIGSASPIIRISDTDAATAQAAIPFVEFYQNLTTARLGYFGFASSSDNNFKLFNQLTTGSITLHTNSLERMRVDENGNVGVNVTSPTDAYLQVHTASDTVHAIQATSTGLGFSFYTKAEAKTNIIANEIWSNSPTNSPAINYYRSRGTEASSLALLSGDDIGVFKFFGTHTGGVAPQRQLDFGVGAAENWSSTARGTKFYVKGTVLGSNARTSWFTIVDNKTTVGSGSTANETLMVEGVLSLQAASAPSGSTGYGKIYVVGNQLWFKDAAGTATQIV